MLITKEWPWFMPLGIEELFRHILPEVIWSDTGQGMERCKPVCDYIKNIYIHKWILTDNQVLINVSFYTHLIVFTYRWIHAIQYRVYNIEYVYTSGHNQAGYRSECVEAYTVVYYWIQTDECLDTDICPWLGNLCFSSGQQKTLRPFWPTVDWKYESYVY